jgi:uncharacterized membrane protein
MPGARFFYGLTLLGYLGTLALLLAWYGWLAPSTHIPRSMALALLLLPLLFPLRGLLHGRRYTFSWSCFLSLLYFIHGVVEAYTSSITLHLGLLEVCLSSLWFISALIYVRITAGSPDTPKQAG